MKHVRKVQLLRLIEEVNRFLEPHKEAIKSGTKGRVTIDGTEYKVPRNGKFEENSIGLISTELLDHVLSTEAMSLRVMESGELPSSRPDGDEMVQSSVPAGYSVGGPGQSYEKH